MHPDLKGTVRTVTVCFRQRRGKALKTDSSYPTLTPETMVVPVQRLGVMLPREKQEGEAQPAAPGGIQAGCKVVHPVGAEQHNVPAPTGPLVRRSERLKASSTGVHLAMALSQQLSNAYKNHNLHINVNVSFNVNSNVNVKVMSYYYIFCRINSRNRKTAVQREGEQLTDSFQHST